MKTRSGLMPLLIFGLVATAAAPRATAQTANSGQSAAENHKAHHEKKSRSAGGEIGSGSADIGKGAAKGAGNLAAGAGKGAVNLVTLHPIDAAASVGKGGVVAGKDVAVGTTKGTAKIVTGVGKGIKHIF